MSQYMSGYVNNSFVYIFVYIYNCVGYLAIYKTDLKI